MDPFKTLINQIEKTLQMNVRVHTVEVTFIQ